MYVSLTRVGTSDQPIENATIVAQEMVAWLRDVEGFEGFLMLSRPGTTLGLTFWQSREIADRQRVARMQFLHRMPAVAGGEVEEMVDYEVTLASLGPSLADSPP